MHNYRSNDIYIDDEPKRHWSPDSEKYAPADVLVEYLAQGCELDGCVTLETVSFGRQRYSTIYHFTLKRNGLTFTVPVVANPIVYRLVKTKGLTEKYSTEWAL